MREGTNMGIMTTLKKPTAESPSPLRHRRVRAAPVEIGGGQPFAVSSR